MTVALSDSVENALAKALRRTKARRQLSCDGLQLLEILLEERRENSLSEVVTRQLRLREPLRFDPPFAELHPEVESFVFATAAKMAGDSEVQPYHVLEALLSAGSSIEAGLREYIRDRMNTPGVDCEIGNSNSTLVCASGQTAGDDRSSTPSALGTYEPDTCDWQIDRPDCTDQIIMTLLHDNVLVVGEEGCGRRTAMALAARKLFQLVRDGKVPPMSFWSLSSVRLISGTSYRGELESKVERLLAQLYACPATPILVVRDVQFLVSGRSDSSPDIASLLLPALEQKRIRLLAHVTPDWYRERLEHAPGFLAQFRLTRMESADAGLSQRLLARQGTQMSQKFGVAVSEAEIAEAVGLAHRLLSQKALPGAAVSLIEDAASNLSFETSMLEFDPGRANSPYWSRVGEVSRTTTGLPQLTRKHLLYTLAVRQGIPFDHLDASAARRAQTFSDNFRSRIFGQEDVRDQLTKSVKVALTGLADVRRPRAQLLFVGPPGTGKTECARLLAEHLMGDADALLRFDMSEFADKSSVSTLLGSDKGLVGSEEGGRLTEPLRLQPHRVILFDEIEKADRAIYNLFLQILDYGFISDKRGHKVSFRHSVLIFTSNAGWQDGAALHRLSRGELVTRLQGHFSPEFLDRMDRLVAFQPLNRRARLLTAGAQLEVLRRQIKETHGIELTWDRWVAAAGARASNGEPGVRHLHRWINDQVKPALASMVLNGRTECPGSLLRLVSRAHAEIAVVKEGVNCEF